MLRTSNPILKPKAFSGVQSYSGTDSMTIQGTVNKTFLMLFLLLISASYTWNSFFRDGQIGAVSSWITMGAIGGLVVAIVICFKKEWSPVLAPVYALLEGLFLGGISSFFEMRYPGIVVQAVGLTMGTLLGLLLAYRSGWIQATENFKLGVFAATAGIAIFYLVSMVLGFFGIHLSVIHGSSMMGILFSGFVVVIAALNLVLDFDFIEQASRNTTPKYMEWYGAFGLMVTLIWLYLEILRLLAKLNDRR